MYKVKLSLNYEEASIPNRPYRVFMTYANPLTQNKNTFSIRNEKGESKVTFLKRVLNILKNREEITKLVKEDIIRSTDNYNIKNLEADLIKEIEDMSLELNIDIN